jgi:signal peptidase
METGNEPQKNEDTSLVSTKEKNKTVKKTFKIIGDVFLVLFILFGIYITVTSLVAKSNGGVSNLFGNAPMSVQSDSMKGTFEKGDLIFVKLLSFDNDHNPSETLEEGKSIVTFKYTLQDTNGNNVQTFLTHQYVKRTLYGSRYLYEFKGTYAPNGETIDSQIVEEKAIVGVYTGTKWSGFGKVTDFLTSSTGYLVIFVVPAAILFFYALYRLIITIIRVNKQNLTEKDAAYYMEQKEKMRDEILKELEEEKKGESKHE